MATWRLFSPVVRLPWPRSRGAQLRARVLSLAFALHACAQSASKRSGISLDDAVAAVPDRAPSGAPPSVASSAAASSGEVSAAPRERLEVRTIRFAWKPPHAGNEEYEMTDPAD